MFTIECEKCGKEIYSTWLGELLSVRLNRKECTSCGAKYELANPFICYFPNGLLFGLLTFGLNYLEFGYANLRYVAAAFVSIIFYPVFIGLFGKWRIARYSDISWSKARKWGTISVVSWWVFGIAAVVIILGLYIQLFQVMWNIEAFVEGMEEDVTDLSHWIQTYMMAGVGFALAAYIVSAFARYKKKQLEDKAPPAEQGAGKI